MWFHRTQNKQATLFLVVDDQQAALITWDNGHWDKGHPRNNHATHPFVVHSYETLPAEWFLHGAPWHVSSFTTYLQSYVQQHTLKKPLLICACSGDTQYEKTINLAHMPTQAAIPPDKHYAHYAWHASLLPTPQELPLAHANHTTTFEISTPTSSLDISTSADTNTPLSKPISYNNTTQSTPIQEKLLSTIHSPTQLQDPSLNLSSYLVSGMPHSDVLRLRLCADKSGCILHRMTTIRASMQPLYVYCQQHGITPGNTHDTETAQRTTTHQEPTHDATPHYTTDSSDTLLNMLCAPLPETYNRRLVLSALGLSLFERNKI